MKINELIRKYRLDKHLSQEELGNMLGVSHASVSDMERAVTNHLPTKLVEMLMGIETVSDENPKSMLAEHITVQELIDTIHSIKTDTWDIKNILTAGSKKGKK